MVRPMQVNVQATVNAAEWASIPVLGPASLES